jgi:hypothetical protein
MTRPTPPCPLCDGPTASGRRATQIRRGARVVTVEVEHWTCTNGCLDEDGVSPFRFEDASLLRTNSDGVRAAWLARFGEPLPPSGRPGRKPAERRDIRVQLLLTPTELAEVDRQRGSTPRSEFIRRRILRG